MSNACWITSAARRGYVQARQPPAAHPGPPLRPLGYVVYSTSSPEGKIEKAASVYRRLAGA